MNRIFSKSIALIALVGAMTAFSTSKAEAAFLTGQIDVTGSAIRVGDVVNVQSAEIQEFVGVGSLGALVANNDVVNHVASFDFVTFVPQSPLWTHVISGLSFHLSTVNITQDAGGTLSLSGTGVFKHALWDDTDAIWLFTMNQFGQGSFSSSAIVPEPASLALLGLGLAGVAAARRRKQA